MQHGKRTIRYTTFSDWALRAGRASDYIQPFRVRRSQRFIVLCRVSSHDQGRRRNLDGQERNLSQAVESRGGIVVEVIRHRWSGHGPRWLDKLYDASHLASQHDATLLAATTDRFIRNRFFRTNRRERSHVQARKIDLIELPSFVRLMTYLDPDASPGECRSLLTRWSGRSGRPRMIDRVPGHRKRFREQWLKRVLQLHRKGWRLRSIAKRIAQESGRPISHMTIANWINGAN